MSSTSVDLANWPRTTQSHWFRAYVRPHYATTTRFDVTTLMTQRKPAGVSVYRACLHAIGVGLHAVPELMMRFQGDQVTAYDSIDLSITVPSEAGAFTYADLRYHPDFAAFDAMAADVIAKARKETKLGANAEGQADVAYLSCMPWRDYTSINNAMPHKDDCTPRVSWGKIVQEADGAWRMAMTLEVHHALVDGAHVGAFFAAVQSGLDEGAQEPHLIPR